MIVQVSSVEVLSPGALFGTMRQSANGAGKVRPSSPSSAPASPAYKGVVCQLICVRRCWLDSTTMPLSSSTHMIECRQEG